MGTKIIKIKRFPTEKCSDFMAGYTKRRKPKMKTKQNVSRIFSSACQNRITKKGPHPLSECGPSLLFRFSLWSNNH